MNLLHAKFLFLYAIVFMVNIGSAYAAPQYRSERVVIVKPGETLSQIVERELRSSIYWPTVARYNNIKNPKVLQNGQKLRIPLTHTRSIEAATVLFVKGKVDYTHAKTYGSTTRTQAPVSRGDHIEVGDEIFTGNQGFVSLEFSSGSVINVHPNSHVYIIDIDCADSVDDCIIELYSDEGEIQSRVKRRSNQTTQFSIDTPSGVAAVRGTDFDVNINNESAVTGVVSGLVDMSASGEKVGINKGFGVVTEQNTAPGLPLPLLSPPSIDELPPRLSLDESIAWDANPQAAGYLYFISKDQAANRVVQSGRVSDSTFNLALNQEGDYFLTLRALDDSALKGMPKTLPLKAVSVKKGSIPSLSLESIDGLGMASLEKSIADATLYELQISRTNDFSQYASVDIVSDQSVALSFDESDKLWSRVRAVYSDYVVSEYSPVIAIDK